MRGKRWVMLDSQGQALVEVLVGFALIVFVGTVFTGGMVLLRTTVKRTVVASATDRQVSDIAENIKAGVENYQVNFNYDEDISEALPPDGLPMAWDNGITAPKVDCQKCAGRFGFLIQPDEKRRGLYKVTLRMTHTTWKEAKIPYKDYVFVVSAK